MDFEKMFINFIKKVTVALFLLCMKVKIHKKTQYEVSMTVYMGRIANQKYQTGCHLKPTSQNH